VAQKRLRDSFPEAEIVEDEAVQAAGVFLYVDNNALFGEAFQRLLVFGGKLDLGEGSREQAGKHTGECFPGF
jgi:hypothetical protein